MLYIYRIRERGEVMEKAEDVGKDVFVVSSGRTRRELVKHDVYKGVKTSRTFHQIRRDGGWVNSDIASKERS